MTDRADGDWNPRSRAAFAEAALVDTQFGPVEWVPETGSTNTDLLIKAAQNQPAGTVRVADHQTAGRGRRDRTWTTAPGDALLASALLRPTQFDAEIGLVVCAFAVAGAEAAAAVGASGVQIKWPNDLVIGGPGEHRKLAGFLAQSQITGDEMALVVGFGINVIGDRLPEGIGSPAALGDLAAPPETHELLVEVLRRADALLVELDAGRPEPVLDRYRSLSATIGTRVRVSLDAEAGDDAFLEGRAVDVSSTGALVIDDGATTRELYAGDVISVR